MPDKRYLIVIPSTVTLLGVFFGFLCLIWAPHDPYAAGCAIIGASLCDMIDGRLARLTGTSSAFGVQLDSLADLASFGIAPAFLVWTWAAAPTSPAGSLDWALPPVFLYVVGCAVRLARFNVDAEAKPHGATERRPDEPGFHMVGLATPVAALLITTLMMTSYELDWAWLRSAPLFVAVALALTALMVSTIPFPSYKRFKSKGRQLAFFVAITSGLTLLIAGGPGGAVLCGLLCLYVVLGLATALLSRARPVRAE